MLNQELSELIEKAKHATAYAKSVSMRKILEEFIYESVRYTGNKAGFSDVQQILKGNIDNVNLRANDVTDILIFFSACEYVVNLANENKPITVENIININEKLTQNLPLETRGVYRSLPVSVANMQMEHPDNIEEKLRLMLGEHKMFASELLPVEREAVLHLKLFALHPFLYANGMTAKLVTMLELLKQGYMPIIISYELRDEYHNAIKQYIDNKNVDDLSDLFVELELASARAYGKMLVESGKQEKKIAVAENIVKEKTKSKKKK